MGIQRRETDQVILKVAFEMALEGWVHRQRPFGNGICVDKKPGVGGDTRSSPVCPERQVLHRGGGERRVIYTISDLERKAKMFILNSADSG